MAHTKLDIFQHTKELVLTCYQLSNKLPDQERFAMAQQLRRAALSVHLNLAEGCSRKSGTEQIRFMEISRSSLVEVDTALDIALALNYLRQEDLGAIETIINKSFAGLSGIIKHQRNQCNAS